MSYVLDDKMSKERGLLNLCAVAFKASNICPLLLKDISELLAQPEHTSEPEQKPLSDAQIAELWGDKHSGKTHMVKNFARAIEKAHGIGGGG